MNFNPGAKINGAVPGIAITSSSSASCDVVGGMAVMEIERIREPLIYHLCNSELLVTQSLFFLKIWKLSISKTDLISFNLE